MRSLDSAQRPLDSSLLTAAIALAAFVSADQLAPGHRMLFGFSLDVANLRVSLEAEAANIKRE